MPTIVVATKDGVSTFDHDGHLRAVAHEGRSVSALGRMRDDVWAIAEEAELWRATHAGWTHVADLGGLRATCIAGMGDAVFVGTSEARLFRLAGEVLEPVTAFDDAPGRETWHTPWGGPPDTRSIANWDDDVFVNVHVGGIVRTDDDGRRWTPTIDIDADVHQVTTADGMVLAACARGLAVSTDRGATWTSRIDGLAAPYSRAVAVCGDSLLVSASTGPRGGDAAVYRGRLSGGAFERCVAGLPPSFSDNIDSHCLDALPEGSVAAFGTSEGSVYRSTDQGASWEVLATGLAPVRRVLAMP
ncbi:MAG: hypothetical protein OEV60_07400 [Actinomycetota bacterium]|nr:hypothetical protein [Actinomycetota bacterium]MDH5225081.1 hypothetical protein [Actinomycetota bacterium]